MSIIFFLSSSVWLINFFVWAGFVPQGLSSSYFILHCIPGEVHMLCLPKAQTPQDYLTTTLYYSFLWKWSRDTLWKKIGLNNQQWANGNFNSRRKFLASIKFFHERLSWKLVLEDDRSPWTVFRKEVPRSFRARSTKKHFFTVLMYRRYWVYRLVWIRNFLWNRWWFALAKIIPVRAMEFRILVPRSSLKAWLSLYWKWSLVSCWKACLSLLKVILDLPWKRS